MRGDGGDGDGTQNNTSCCFQKLAGGNNKILSYGRFKILVQACPG